MKKYIVDIIVLIGVILLVLIVYMLIFTRPIEPTHKQEHKFNIHKSSSYGRITKDNR